jgi:hypothetical protein
MREILKWWLFWITLCAVLALVGCESGTSHLYLIAQADGGALDSASALDLQLSTMADGQGVPLLDAGAIIVYVDARDGSTLEAAPPRDITPALACDTFGPLAATSTLSITLPTTDYCFKLCPALFEPINPLDYAWACVGVTDTDRTIMVNGQKVSCVGQASRSSGSLLSALADGAWTFALSAGGHNGDFIKWIGALRVCP